MVDQLAKDYASQPVVFLEQTSNLPIGDRQSYFWAAAGSGSISFPWVMADSGHQVHPGPTDYYNTYKQMVDAELARAPLADVQATQTRVGNRLRFEVKVTNWSGGPLSSDNRAKVHVIVYENAKISLTSRFVRAEVHAAISSPLNQGASRSFTLETGDITGVDWTKLSAVAVVDYLPGGSTAYDMLQAAMVKSEESSFTIKPGITNFVIDAARPSNPSSTIQTSGPAGVTWTASEDISWLTLDAATGSAGTPIVLHVNSGGLANGIQSGALHISAAGMGVSFVQDVTITAYYGKVYFQQAPVIGRP